MKNLLLAIVATALAGLGGALAVFGGYDDSPGGTLLGVAVVFGAMVFNARSARRVAAAGSDQGP